MLKRKILATTTIFFITMLGIIVPGEEAKAADTSWNLAWSDEFNGNTINTRNWTYDTGTGSGGWGNNELEYYTNRPENARIENGNLVIEARKESYGGMGYTSARMKTQALKSFTYGKVEARMKLPAGQGIWPAFWMLGENIPQVSWPACGEIDIMEHINNEPYTHGTIHWDTNGHAEYGKVTPNIDVTQYHVYSIEWDKNAIKWLVDGTQYLEANIANNINGTDEFHKPFFILFNLAVGGNWPGNPNGTTVLPAKMYVDYVRVYQQGSTTDIPTGSYLPSSTWYLFNQPVNGVSSASQDMQTVKSGISGWQPIKTISTGNNLWTTPTINGTYNAGKWNFTLWTNNPGISNVAVDLYKVNSNGTGEVLLGTQTIDISKTGGGNHPTVYSYNLDQVAFNNQRLMLKIHKTSGGDAVMCYNANDFPTRLVTP
ncbi:beta-glucanase (GH16 family) [Clostridium saccharoperbutylacetonicum]|uniref:Beta-glucanase BglA n=1 Tax=Clostridium saccharoperbutylacetonicum N1-4(HMT) TaxID=931276 RepID=M1MX50_9CLOT|nr:glycoside hydrolase family 16 protein [Clostridium saccharoperbutylacetonicum]AGF56052.1 beta-glucanase BglA [Clostridium saccharoperbutylacetonicum N1-4(HMT)]NRT63209.1 beta-glucanase (GH16 family) [Clostridium saccharoperbutylacetonicum]NSB26569.1 beta-glucanase (GH16 family) [Clostridium saccharoperbutylacetonicum]NSB45920.1 beta-glucanase (GH16 family) [Clostridium saccharoperbutylacetonicum]